MWLLYWFTGFSIAVGLILTGVALGFALSNVTTPGPVALNFAPAHTLGEKDRSSDSTAARSTDGNSIDVEKPSETPLPQTKSPH